MDTLQDLLKENNPCRECIIKTMCNKTMIDGSACEQLQKAITKAVADAVHQVKLKTYVSKLEKKKYENKN